MLKIFKRKKEIKLEDIISNNETLEKISNIKNVKFKLENDIFSFYIGNTNIVLIGLNMIDYIDSYYITRHISSKILKEEAMEQDCDHLLEFLEQFINLDKDLNYEFFPNQKEQNIFHFLSQNKKININNNSSIEEIHSYRDAGGALCYSYNLIYKDSCIIKFTLVFRFGVYSLNFSNNDISDIEINKIYKKLVESIKIKKKEYENKVYIEKQEKHNKLKEFLSKI